MLFLELWDPEEEQMRSREGEKIKFDVGYSNFKIVQRGIW